MAANGGSCAARLGRAAVASKAVGLAGLARMYCGSLWTHLGSGRVAVALRVQLGSLSAGGTDPRLKPAGSRGAR